jgi:excisionase family DNA binding protein
MIVQQTHAPLPSLPSAIFPSHQPVDLLKTYCALPDLERRQRFFSTTDIATRYGVAQRTVQDWISNGLIAAVKIGKKYHVDAHSVDAYLQWCAQQREVI